jgi:uncharacterized membrane protein SpoIIM required for sporulation
MKEFHFVQKNEDLWKDIEKFLDGESNITPDELAVYYTRIINDLSYVKTFYPKSQVVGYLNHLSSALHRRIYKSKKEEKERFLTFWTQEIPLAIRASHRDLLMSLIVFLVAIAIGGISTYIDPEFPRVILGDYYVDMTLNNIEEGDPLGVYRDEQKDRMFLFIGSNNIRVGLLSLILGIIAPFLAGFILVSNGVMVGAFQGMFVAKGLTWISFSTIFIHGALELSAIVIVAGAGMAIGNSWWYPKTYSRRDSLLMGARRGFKILIAIIPVIVIAAIIESYVTYQYQELGSFWRAFIIILSFAYIAWYFIYLPIVVERKTKLKTIHEGV